MQQYYIFGYGSLVLYSKSSKVVELRGYKRVWNVAMDNSIDISGYRYFIDPSSNKLDLPKIPASSDLSVLSGLLARKTEGSERQAGLPESSISTFSDVNVPTGTLPPDKKASESILDSSGENEVPGKSSKRPAVFVTFLNLETNDGSSVNGVLIPVSLKEMNLLDMREQNYTRIEVTKSISSASSNTKIFTYIGTKEAKTRYKLGYSRNIAVINKHYKETIERGYAKLGANEYSKFMESTIKPNLPLLSLSEIVVL